MENIKNADIKVHGLMLMAIILAASSFPVGALITNALPPELLMFFRFLLAALLFAPFIFLKHGMVLPSKRALLNYIILSIPLVVFFWCMFESLRYTSVVNTGALYTTVPAITAIFAFIINKDITGKLRTFGLALGTMGALWIVFRGDLDALLRLDLNYGDLIFLVGCLSLGMYNPLVKRLHSGEPMEVMTFWILSAGSVWLLIVSVKGFMQIDLLHIEQSTYFGILYLSLFSTLITFFVINYSTVRIGATKVAAYGFLTPAIVIAISLLIGMEPFEWITVPGLLLIFAAMIVIQRESTKDKVVA